MNWQNLFDYILYFLVLPFVSISFVLTSMTNDSRIFIGTEAIADRFYPLPYGWDAAYEVKPIGNRILNWVLYKIANFFVPMVTNQYNLFGYVVKLTALILLIICCYYISKRIPFHYGFIILFLGFACQANFSILMAEWFAALFGLVAITLCFERNRNWQFVAGLLCVYIGLLKTITFPMTISCICAVILLGGAVDWKRAISGFLTGCIAFLILCFTVWPYSIGDMIMSRYVAHVGMYDIKTLLRYLWMTQDTSNMIKVFINYMPIVLIGMALACYLLVWYWFKENKAPFLLFVLMWAVPFMVVMAQEEFIIYHYTVLCLPAIVSIVLFDRLGTKKWDSAVLNKGSTSP